MAQRGLSWAPILSGLALYAPERTVVSAKQFESVLFALVAAHVLAACSLDEMTHATENVDARTDERSPEPAAVLDDAMAEKAEGSTGIAAATRRGESDAAPDVGRLRGAADGIGNAVDSGEIEAGVKTADAAIDAAVVFGRCALHFPDCPAGYWCFCPGPNAICQCHLRCTSAADCSAPAPLCGCPRFPWACVSPDECAPTPSPPPKY
jgi:hypothetical protein